jgi:hypothetical protein
MFWKKQEHKDTNYIIKVFFSNGCSDKFLFTKEQKEEFIHLLSSDWESTIIVGNKFGIKFSDVSYYIVETN